MSENKKMISVNLTIEDLGNIFNGTIEQLKTKLDIIYSKYSSSYSNIQIRITPWHDIRWIGERMETDSEFNDRLKYEKMKKELRSRIEVVKQKKIDAKIKREKTLLKNLLKKYGNE
jgi:hypothetical protein